MNLEKASDTNPSSQVQREAEAEALRIRIEREQMRREEVLRDQYEQQALQDRIDEQERLEYEQRMEEQAQRERDEREQQDLYLYTDDNGDGYDDDGFW